MRVVGFMAGALAALSLLWRAYRWAERGYW